MSQNKVRATSSFDLICVSSHSSYHKYKSQDLPVLELLKHRDMILASFQIQAILLHHFDCVCIGLARETFTGSESFQQGYKQYVVGTLNVF